MIEKWFEPFTLLEKDASPDGLGGESVSLSPGIGFRGVLSRMACAEKDAAGRFLLEENPVLLHEFDVTLAPGDHVRRDRTGTVYRVAASSDSLRAPAFSGLRIAQVPVKKVTCPC